MRTPDPIRLYRERLDSLRELSGRLQEVRSAPSQKQLQMIRELTSRGSRPEIILYFLRTGSQNELEAAVRRTGREHRRLLSVQWGCGVLGLAILLCSFIPGVEITALTLLSVGVLLIGLCFLAAFSMPSLTGPQQLVLRSSLALGAAMIAAFIPGQIRGKIGPLEVTGAIAVFVIVLRLKIRP